MDMNSLLESLRITNRRGNVCRKLSSHVPAEVWQWQSHLTLGFFFSVAQNKRIDTTYHWYVLVWSLQQNSNKASDRVLCKLTKVLNFYIKSAFFTWFRDKIHAVHVSQCLCIIEFLYVFVQFCHIGERQITWTLSPKRKRQFRTLIKANVNAKGEMNQLEEE